MLNPKGKPSQPDWVRPYQPFWIDGQWVVIFVDQDSAWNAMSVMKDNEGCPDLAMARYPDGGTLWYVGVED